jgi:hypothetical protein
MAHDVPEIDWKLFRRVREVALERFCARVLEELEAVRVDASRTHHERYGAIFRLLQERDAQMAQPTALALNILVASLASWQFWRAGYFSWPLFWPFAALSVPLAFIGAMSRFQLELSRCSSFNCKPLGSGPSGALTS